MIVSRKPAAAPGRAETANAQHPFALMVAWIRFRANRSSAVAAVLTGCFLAVSSAAVVHAETAAPAFRVIAFYNGKVEQAHTSFVAEANRWFAKMAAQQGFAYELTDDWSKLNRESLARFALVVFLDARPDAPPSGKPSASTWSTAAAGWDSTSPVSR